VQTAFQLALFVQADNNDIVQFEMQAAAVNTPPA
jgi:hypothetical protein